MAEFRNGEAQPLAPGLYTATVLFATGPIVLSKSVNGKPFQEMTDGTFTATGDAAVIVGRNERFSVTLGAGDSFDMEISQSNAI
jgi:hypothetical protein